MTTILKFPSRRDDQSQWDAVARAIRSAASVHGLDQAQTEGLIRSLMREWTEFFVSGSIPILERPLEIRTRLSDEDAGALQRYLDALAQDVRDAMSLHFLGLLQELAWDRAHTLAQGAALRRVDS